MQSVLESIQAACVDSDITLSHTWRIELSRALNTLSGSVVVQPFHSTQSWFELVSSIKSLH